MPPQAEPSVSSTPITNDRRPSPWNSLEISKIVVGTFTPIMLLILGTVLKGIEEDRRQVESEQAEQQRRSERDSANDRDITKEYIRLLASDARCNNSSAISLIIELSTPSQSGKLKEHFLEQCTEAPNIVALKQAVSSAANKSTIHSLVGDLKGEYRYDARASLKRLFNTQNIEVVDAFREALRQDSGNYRVALGVLLVLGDPSSKKLEDDGLRDSVRRLGESSNMRDSTFREAFTAASAHQSL